MTSDPIRTCVGCGKKSHPDSLFRLVVGQGAIVVDSRRCLPGRGAWVHRDEDCLNRVLKSPRLLRALRIPESVKPQINFVDALGLSRE